MNPDHIRVKPAQEMKPLFSSRLRNIHVKEQLADYVIAVTIFILSTSRKNVRQPRHRDVDLFALVLSLEHGAITI